MSVNFTITRIPLSLRREGEGLPTIIRRNLESLLSVEDAAAIAAGLQKAEAEEQRMIQLSEKFRSREWKRLYHLAGTDADGSEAAQKFLVENPLKSAYAGSGKKAKQASRHRRHLALAGIAAEVGRFNLAMGHVLRDAAAKMEAALEAMADATGIEVDGLAEIGELRLQAGEHTELGLKAATPTTHRLAQNLGDLVNIAAARLAIEPQAAAPAVEKAKKRVAAIDSAPVPESPASVEDAGEGDDETLLALS